MGEIRFVGTGETRGYPYLVCKKRIVSPGKTRGYPYPLCKNISIFHGCMVWIEKSVTRVTDRHHEACRVMPNSDPE